MRCLLVDDYESVRMGVAAILSSRPDIQICGEASNGKEAIEKARELKPDLIILDVTMPVLDGINSAKEIRTFLPEVPILFFSMHDGVYLVHEGKLAGVQGFVNKTEARATLLDAVGALVNKQTYFPDRGASTRTVQFSLGKVQSVGWTKRQLKSFVKSRLVTIRTNRVETALGNFRSVRPKFVVRKGVRANVNFAVAEYSVAILAK